MTVTALRIGDGATTERVGLPDDYDGQRMALRTVVGGSIDPGIYHRQAVLHIHSEGAATGQPLNLGAWALACAWRGVELYGLHGTSGNALACKNALTRAGYRCEDIPSEPGQYGPRLRMLPTAPTKTKETTTA